MTTIIAKNNTSSAIPLDDLGVEIPGSGQRDLTLTFSVVDIYSSTELRDNVQSGDITINDGIEDLDIEDSLAHINFETEYEDVDPVATEEQPDSTSVIWINPNQYEPYYYSEVTGLWLSASKNIYTYGRSGNIDGAYLGIGGWSTGGYYYVPEPGGVVTSVYVRADSGNLSKGFEIQINSINQFSLNLVDGLYENRNIGVLVHGSSIMQVWCATAGGPVGDVVCQLTMHWRNGA